MVFLQVFLRRLNSLFESRTDLDTCSFPLAAAETEMIADAATLEDEAAPEDREGKSILEAAAGALGAEGPPAEGEVGPKAAELSR